MFLSKGNQAVVVVFFLLLSSFIYKPYSYLKLLSQKLGEKKKTFYEDHWWALEIWFPFYSDMSYEQGNH